MNALPDDLELLRYLWVDNANVIRSKGVPLYGHQPDLDRGVRISQAQMALPIYADAVVPQTGLLPTHDVTLVPDWSTLRLVGAGQGAVSCDIHDGDSPWVHCPRTFLRRMDQRARAAGLAIRVGSELEFTLLRDGAPIDNFAYAQDAAFDVDAAVITELLATLHAQGVAVAQCHPESGPGQWEISLRPLSAVAAADAIVAVRQTVRAVAARNDMTVSFLPLVTPDGVGAGMHLHMSFTGDDDDGFGVHGEPFMAGVLAAMPALLAATAPSVMSLSRFRPHFWAGAFLGWGRENKEAPLRVVPTATGAARDVEYKSSDATANPYISIGCLVAAGLDGIERSRELPPPIVGDPGLLEESERSQAGIVAMPDSPADVLAAFGAASLFAEAMGSLHASYCEVQKATQDHMLGLGFDEVASIMIDRI